MNKITIKDLAKEAGVSISTVSKALNGVDVVKADTRDRILEISRRHNYVPNLMGKQLKTGKTKMIGFYTDSITGPYFNTLVESIARSAEKEGYGINVFISNNKQVVLNSIMGNIVDGIIGFQDIITKEDLKAMKREKIKAVFIDRNTADETIGSVVFDSYQKGYEATEFLIQSGHAKIGFITGYEGVYDSDERFNGYKSALNDYSIMYDKKYVLAGLFEENASYNSMTLFLKNNVNDVPTTFIAGNDLSAIGAIKSLNSLGYSIPEDFSIVGFDNIELLEYFVPKLTTVCNPISQQGERAVEHLLELINGEKKGEIIELSGELIIRNSTSIL
ncbi:LacI family DNA-binding transcriptional regulator [Desemzia sp. FAM 23991]|uniref:LacI family DNA-binding transcriptional regulator n=1 Tax=unclassified Desemzia TaxID=2685243 RepID=UPI003887D4E8